MKKAQLARLVRLTKAAQGLTSPEETKQIIDQERAAAKNHGTARPTVTGTGPEPTAEED